MQKDDRNMEIPTTTFQKITYPEGPQVLKFRGLSAFPGVEHLITTRLGGVSEGIFSSMNVSFTRGDDPAHVMENYRRVASCFGAGPDRIVCTDQTHTANIRVATRADAGKGVTVEKDYRDVDGLLTNEPGLILAGFYADCVPLLFYDPCRSVIAVAHSGWRGTVQQIGARMVQTMQAEFGCDPAMIHVGIGPSICRNCYEVSEDVILEVQRSLGDAAVKEVATPNGKPQKYQLDLWKCNELILLQAGILPEHLEITDLCTCCHPEVLFSHRATGGKRGNLGAFIMLTTDKAR